MSVKKIVKVKLTQGFLVKALDYGENIDELAKIPDQKYFKELLILKLKLLFLGFAYNSKKSALSNEKDIYTLELRRAFSCDPKVKHDAANKIFSFYNEKK